MRRFSRTRGIHDQEGRCNQIKDKLTYANVMATIAVFLVLGGGAYAASVAKKNTVTTKSVKNGSLKGIDVAKDS